MEDNVIRFSHPDYNDLHKRSVSMSLHPAGAKRTVATPEQTVAGLETEFGRRLHIRAGREVIERILLDDAELSSHEIIFGDDRQDA